MFVNIYDKNGKEIEKGQFQLPEKIFNIKWNPDLVWQVAVSMMSNQRKVIAHAKTREEVRGGGKKPWRQKGTGRARAGSIRSPLWKGGGVTFGPTKERNFKKKINKKMKRGALLSVISKKNKDSEIKVIDNLNIDSFKTKEAAAIINKLFPERKSLLVISEKNNSNLKKAIRNIKKVKYLPVNMLNVLDLLNHKYMLIEKEAIKGLVEKFQPKA